MTKKRSPFARDDRVIKDVAKAAAGVAAGVGAAIAAGARFVKRRREPKEADRQPKSAR